ncbi:hypothetical protein KFS98_003617 [Salmonella enterica]|nr:hypothetical protein [Salmonella enterica]
MNTKQRLNPATILDFGLTETYEGWERDLLNALEWHADSEHLVQLPVSLLKELLQNSKAISPQKLELQIFSSENSGGIEVIINNKRYKLEYANDWMELYSDLDVDTLSPQIAGYLANYLTKALAKSDGYDSRLDSYLASLVRITTLEDRKII